MNRKGGIIILYGCNSAGGSGKPGLPSFQTDCCDCGQICICRVTGPEDLNDPFDSVNQLRVLVKSLESLTMMHSIKP